eukprot:m.65188 g.65188  ORF g.65188 m.65188 type:complete len:65 (+) comp49774_c0_seq1:72-266(+)
MGLTATPTSRTRKQPQTPNHTQKIHTRKNITDLKAVQRDKAELQNADRAHTPKALGADSLYFSW